ncbi:MAG: LytR C-terminal domain-containing protein [Acidimicrobiales bacterium]
MMRGTHARDDGSFGRSASTQTLKGAALLFAALLIGVVLLHTAPRAVTSITTGSGATPTTLRSSGAPVSTPDTSTTVAGPRPASQVRVLVANGAGVPNLGAKIRSQLNAAGYNTDKPAIDAPTSNNITSSIYFQSGFEAEAMQLASVLSLPQTAVQQLSGTSPPVPSTNLVNVDIVVIAGQDIQTTQPPGATVAPGSTPSTTPTTIHHTTTTRAPTTTTRAPTATTKAPPPATTSPPTSPPHSTTTINLK